MGKVIVMGGNPLGGNLEGAPGGAGNTGLPAGYLADVFRVARIFEHLEGLRVAIDGLKTATASHAEDIKQLTQRVYAIPYIKRDVAQNTRDLNRLGERHTRELRDLERQLNGLGSRQTTGLNNLGIALRGEIGDLRGKLNTGETIFKLFLGALGLAIPIVWAIVSHHVSLVFH